MNVKSYLFDFDGTFVDTAPGLIDAANRLFKKHGKDFYPSTKGGQFPLMVHTLF